jgi:hypothetical protein
MTKIKSIVSFGAAGIVALALTAGVPVAPAQAADVGSPGDATNPATWDQTVRIGANSKITISSSNATPSPAIIPAVAGTNGGFGTVATQLSVSTNDPNGSQLTAKTVNASADLVSASVTSKVVAAAGVLTANKWGYTFATGSTNTVPTITSSFSAMPASGGTAVVLLPDNNAAGTQSGFINYGAVVDYSLPAGQTYENQVHFTASIIP